VRKLLLLGLLLAPCAACGASADADPAQPGSHTTQAWDLVRAYERAHKEKNLGRALALVHLGSVDTSTRDTLILNLSEDFEKELVSARLLPLKGDETMEYTIEKRRMVPNLKVDKRLRLEFRSGGATEYFVGTINGRDMIATACEAH
jgi:hypothetical protein